MSACVLINGMNSPSNLVGEYFEIVDKQTAEVLNLRFFDYTSSFHDNIMNASFSFFGGGPMEEEERIVKGDDVIVELDATLEDLYMGGSLKVRSCLARVLIPFVEIHSALRYGILTSYCFLIWNISCQDIDGNGSEPDTINFTR